MAVFQKKGPAFILERRNCGKKTLAELVEILSGYSRGAQFALEAPDIGHDEGMNCVPLDTTADRLLEAIERLEIPHGLPLNFVKLQARIRNWCASQNWNTLGELLRNAGNMGPQEFLAVDNLGKKSAAEMLEFFDALMGRPGTDLRRFMPVVPGTASIVLPLALDDLVASLNPRNTRILEMRLVEGCRLEAIAGIFKCTRELVRQIEKRFLDDVERTLNWFSDDRVEIWQVWEGTGRLTATLADRGSTLGASLLAAAISCIFESTPEGILLRDHWLETFRNWGRELMASEGLSGGVDLVAFAKERNQPGAACRFQSWLEQHFSEGLSVVEMRATRVTRELTATQKTLLYGGESHALRWRSMYERLKRYHSDHGDANVPNGWKTDPQLAAWVSNQRDRRKRGIMPENEWVLLNELGLTWKHRNVGTWEEHLAEIMEFKVRHGHCEIPTVLKENPKLGRFVNSMRTQRKRGALCAMRVAQLDALGFAWSSRNKMEGEAGQSNRKEPSTIKVVIDWSRNGYQYGTETICEQLASDTLVSLLDRLLEVLGPKVIEVASQLRVSRGPFMSKNPRADYWNASANEIYGHKEWRSGYSILTNTGTSQKVEDVTDLLRVLQFTPGSFSVSQLSRSARRLL